MDKEENDKAMKYHTSPKRLKAVEAYTKVFGGTLEDNFAILKGTANSEIYKEIQSAGYTADTDIENNSGQKTQRG